MAGRIPEGFINTVTERIDIVELINNRIGLRKTGINFVGKCPFHQEKTPSFSVNPAKQFYHCFGCGAHGDAIKFVMEYDKLSFVEAVEELAGKLGLEVPYLSSSNSAKTSNAAAYASPAGEVAVARIYTVLAAAKQYFIQQLKTHPAGKSAINYLKQRGFTGISAKEFAFGYAPPGWDNLKRYMLEQKFSLAELEQAGLYIKNAKSTTERERSYDRFRNRIMFPIHDPRGRVIGFGGRVIANDEPKYLNSPETVVFHKGEHLYGLYEVCQKVRKLTSLIVVEGYLDVVALAQANIPNVVATLGTALTAEHLKLLFRLAPEIVFCFDADQAGYKAAIRALEITLSSLSGKHKVNFLFLPEGEDPDSFVRAKGSAAFLQQIDRAMPLADFLFKELAANMNLEAVEDRTQIVLKAQAWLEQIPAGVFKQFMYDRLAQLVGLDRQAITKLNADKSAGSKRRSIKLPQSPKSPARIALALLLRDPRLVVELETDFVARYGQVNLTGIQLLCAITQIVQAQPEINLAELQQQLPPQLAKHFVAAELSNLAAYVPEAGVKQEFLGAISKIKALYREQRLEFLSAKAKLENLSKEDMLQLQQLLSESYASP